MRRYETSSLIGPGAENRIKLGIEAQKKAKEWRAANKGKEKISKEQRDALLREIKKGLKQASKIEKKHRMS